MLTTLQNRQRHKKLAKILANRKPRKKARSSQRPLHLQSKHETRVLSIALKRYDTSAGYWPYNALWSLSDLGILSAIEYIEQLIEECYQAVKDRQAPVGPRMRYEARSLEDKYYHSIPNNISFQKLLARLQASTPQG